MTKHRMPAGEFNHYPARARKLAGALDVIIESHGRPEAVLMSYERYQRLTRSGRTPMEVIADPEAADIDFEIPTFGDAPTPADI